MILCSVLFKIFSGFFRIIRDSLSRIVEDFFRIFRFEMLSALDLLPSRKTPNHFNSSNPLAIASGFLQGFLRIFLKDFLKDF